MNLLINKCRRSNFPPSTVHRPDEQNSLGVFQLVFWDGVQYNDTIISAYLSFVFDVNIFTECL